MTESTNNEFVTASGIAIITDATEVSLIFGTGTVSATSYIDDIVFIPLSAFETEPTKEQLDTYYEEYLNNLEAAYAAETISVENNINMFVERMNEKAQELGMTNTSVSTADGNGGSRDYSTARDAMKMMIVASENEVLTDVWSNTYSNDGANGTHTFSVKNGERIRSITAKTTIINETLLTNYKVLGGKTGTGGGTRCIGVIAEIDGQKVVAVIMGATSEAYRYSSINDLLGIASKKLADSSFDTSTETVEDAPSAIAAVITDDGYEVLYEQEADTRQNLASMTKVLNILTALDYIEEPKTETVILKYSEYGDSLYPYDELTYEDAFYHMMLPSSNTTARVVARSIGEKITNS